MWRPAPPVRDPPHLVESTRFEKVPGTMGVSAFIECIVVCSAHCSLPLQAAKRVASDTPPPNALNRYGAGSCKSLVVMLDRRDVQLKRRKFILWQVAARTKGSKRLPRPQEIEEEEGRRITTRHRDLMNTLMNLSYLHLT